MPSHLREEREKGTRDLSRYVWRNAAFSGQSRRGGKMQGMMPASAGSPVPCRIPSWRNGEDKHGGKGETGADEKGEAGAHRVP